LGANVQSHSGAGIGIGSEEVIEAGMEIAVGGGAADLEQELGAATGPSHLLRLVHARIDQEVGGAFRDRGADP
jgi:hypothetical protein